MLPDARRSQQSTGRYSFSLARQYATCNALSMQTTKIEFSAAALKNLEALSTVNRESLITSDLAALRGGHCTKNQLRLARLDAAGLDFGGTGPLDAAKLAQAQGWADYVEALASHI